MSQEQPQRPQGQQQEPIKYGDVFNVTGQLASQPVAPKVAAMMETGEKTVFGQTGATAAVMHAAATLNERAGFVRAEDATDLGGAEQGVTVTQTDVPGSRIFTETIAGQVVGQYVQPTPMQEEATVGVVKGVITIGQALEAAAQSTGSKPLDQSDAAAIQTAEMRATGSSVMVPGGLAATAQSAATYNARVERDEDKIKLSDVLAAATAKLPADKVATQQDAEAVSTAELRSNPSLAAHAAGVAASITAAAKLNENVNA